MRLGEKIVWKKSANKQQNSANNLIKIQCKIEELGDGGEFLFCGEVLCDTFEQLGHEEETVTVSGQEFLDMFLEEMPSK